MTRDLTGLLCGMTDDPGHADRRSGRACAECRVGRYGEVDWPLCRFSFSAVSQKPQQRVSAAKERNSLSAMAW